MYIARSDHGDVLRDSQTGFENRFQRARSHRIDDGTLGRGKTVRREGIAEALQTACSRCGFRAARR